MRDRSPGLKKCAMGDDRAILYRRELISHRTMAANSNAHAEYPAWADVLKRSERAVSRVLCSRLPGSGDHLSGPSIARRLERSTRKSRTGRPYPLAGDASLCDLAPGGVFQALPVARESGGLLPHRFTLTLAGGLLFCGTFHGVAPCPISGPPCPAELGLSSLRFRRAITSPALIVELMTPYLLNFLLLMTRSLP